jgi:hypothetical protein
MAQPPVAPTNGAPAAIDVKETITIPHLSRERRFCQRSALKLNLKILKTREYLERLEKKRAEVPVRTEDLGRTDIILDITLPASASAAPPLPPAQS